MYDKKECKAVNNIGATFNLKKTLANTVFCKLLY